MTLNSDGHVSDRVYQFLGALRRHGNILGGDRLLTTSNGLTALVTTPEPLALSEEHLSKAAEQLRHKLDAAYGCTVHRLGNIAEESRSCQCGRQSALLVFTST
jgi:hypothetical protein